MNTVEFKELQREFGQAVYNYEIFLKNIYLTDLKYNTLFGETLLEIHKKDVENKLLISVIKFCNEGHDVVQINKFVEDVKADFNKRIVAIVNKKESAKEIIKRIETTPKEYFRELEAVYLKYILESHPVVKAYIKPEETETYEVLKKLYFDCNLGGLKETLELNKELIAPIEYTEDKYTELSQFYYENHKRISADMSQRQQKYPCTKFHTLKDAVTIATEEAELKEQLRKVTEMNENLQKDVTELLKHNIELVSVS